MVLLPLVLLVSGCSQLQFGGGGRGGSRYDGADGRFTIGAGARRLMYGYPVPYSTSHFVLSVNGRQASNNPWFPPTVERLRGELLWEGDSGSPRSSITFTFDGVEVTQRLIPVDRTFADVPLGDWGQYYRIEYEVRNLVRDPKNVGIMLLIDTMIDDNDASQMDADGTRVSRQSAFNGSGVPGELLVYRVPGNRSELTASLVTNKGRAVRPDALYVGKWPYFHGVTWNVNATPDLYTDSGILLRWNETPLAPGGTRYVATHYGLPTAGRISALMNAPAGFRRDSASVYFDLGKSDLTPDARASIDSLLRATSPAGVFIEVFTDAVGNEQANLALSKKRSESVGSYLRSSGVPTEIIIPKSYGETYADQSEDARRTGRQEDRRATIVIFSRE